MSRSEVDHPSLSRRSLLTASASAGALGALGVLGAAGLPESAQATTSGHAMKRATGIQLYTLRGAMSEDPMATLTALAGMGYANLEFAGYHGVAPKDLRARLDDLGLAAPSAHVNPHELKADPMPFIEDALVMGHEYLVVAWLPEEDRQTADDYRGWAEVLNRAGEAAKAAGIRVAYHNHDFEFFEVDGVVPQKLLMEETDPDLVDFELDFFWVRKAGLDIVPILAWAPERFTLAHIKDMDADGNMVDVGTGTIDFAGVLASKEAAHIRYPFVEHDNPPDPFRTAAVAHFHLARALR